MLFHLLDSNLGQRNLPDMTITEKIYSDFFQLMEDDKVYLDPSCDFDTICEGLGVSPDEFNEFLMEELGFTGEEIIARYRKIK